MEAKPVRPDGPLHIKYRPLRWDEIRGNEAVVKGLKSQLSKTEKDRQHAFLLYGPSGCGKTTIARIIKKELKCSDRDFIELNVANTRGIDTIRDMIGHSHFMPWVGGVRIFLLDEAHKITKDAQNALLKILEDTPPHVYFILCTTEPEGIIETIKTRCTKYQVNPLRPTMIRDLLDWVCNDEGKEVADEVLEAISKNCNGSPRQALVLLDQAISVGDPKMALEIVTPMRGKGRGRDSKKMKDKQISNYQKKIVRTEKSQKKISPSTKRILGEEVRMEFVYPTFHLSNFDNLSRATGLYGEWYRLAIKAIWYILHGQIIRTRLVKLGDVEDDCRMNFAFILKSGRGKKEIEGITRKVCNGLGEKVTKVVSYHPEQLVGKVVQERKTREYHQVEGHLADDILIFDDAIELVKSRSLFYRESRRYITTALDRIGENEVTKRQTGIPREEAIRYFPNCSIQILLQPFNISDEVANTGFFRRFLFLLPSIELSKETFSQRIHSTGIQKSQAFDIVLHHLKELEEGGASSKLTFSKKATERFNELHLLLVEYGEGYSKKVSNYIEMISFPLQNLFLKMIAILANSNKRNKVSIFDVEMAFVDLLEFLDSNFEYVERKVQGSLDYEDQGKPSGDDLEMLEWLKQRGAVSYKDSQISIKAYEDEISKRFQISPDGARRRYRKHIWKGWIKGKQKGAYNSKVWLTTRLNGDGEEQGGEGNKVMAEYQKIVARFAKEKAIPLLASREPPLLPSLPLKEGKMQPYHPVPPLKPKRLKKSKFRLHPDFENERKFEGRLKTLEKRAAKEPEREETLWKWETILELFDCRQFLNKVHETKKDLVFIFYYADTISQWTVERIWKKGVLMGYKLVLTFLKEVEGEPRGKKWIREFHTRRAKELVRRMEDLSY